MESTEIGNRFRNSFVREFIHLTNMYSGIKALPLGFSQSGGGGDGEEACMNQIITDKGEVTSWYEEQGSQAVSRNDEDGAQDLGGG